MDDDDTSCIEHVFELRGVTFAMDGAHCDYECVRCGAISVGQPPVAPRRQKGPRRS